MGRKRVTGADTESSKKLVDKPKKKQKSEEEIEAYKKYQKHLKSDYFKAVKEKCLERDKYHCMFCGRTKEEGAILNVHHNNYGYLGSELEHMDCVITLCQSCHRHGHLNRAQ